jgi:hypothetical protein
MIRAEITPTQEGAGLRWELLLSCCQSKLRYWCPANMDKEGQSAFNTARIWLNAYCSTKVLPTGEDISPAMQVQSEGDLVNNKSREHTDTSRCRPEVGAVAELLLPMLLSE